MVITLTLLLLIGLLWVVGAAFQPGGLRVGLQAVILVVTGYALGRMASLW